MTFVEQVRALLLVRHGATPLDKKDNGHAWVRAVIDCFREA